MEHMRNRMMLGSYFHPQKTNARSRDRRASLWCMAIISLSVLLLLPNGIGVCAEELHAEGYAGTIASRAGNEVTFSLKPGIEFGREEELCVYQKHDVIQVGGVIVKASWASIGKVRIGAAAKESATALIVEEAPDTAIRVGDEVGRMPNTSPEIVSLIIESAEVRPRHEVSIFIDARDKEGNDLYYSGEANGGRLESSSDRSPIMLWTAPAQAGDYDIIIRVTDGKGGKAESKMVMNVPPLTESTPHKFACAFGGNSRAPWQLKEATDIEIDERGTMWVLDGKNNLLRASTPTGTEIGTIDLTHGGSSYSVSASKMLLDREGFAYILDASHKTLQKLDKKGNLIATIFDNSTHREFLIEWPSNLASTREGDMLVTDSADGHVITIDKKGRFVLLFSSTASGLGRLITPVSIATNRYGDIYVLDAGNGTIAEFDRFYRFNRTYSSPLEGGAGEILVDNRSGAVFVLDCQRGSVGKLDANGKLKPHINAIAREGSTGPAAASVAIGPDGHIVMGTKNAGIWEFDADGKLLGIRGEENLGKVPDLAATDDGMVLAPDGTAMQVKRFNKHRWLEGRFGEKGQYQGQFQNPARIAVDGEGNSYVFDDRGQRIQKFYPNGAFHKKVNISEDVAGNLKDAVDIDVTPDGRLHILDAKRKAVFILAREGDLSKIVPLTASGTQDGKQIKKPAHIAVDQKGNIYVSDPLAYTVYKFHSEGTRINKLGGKGTAPGQFGRIVGLAVDKQGFVYVLLKDRVAVAKFADDGRFITEIPLAIDKDTPLRYPEALAADSFGALYIFDSYYDAVFKFMQ